MGGKAVTGLVGGRGCVIGAGVARLVTAKVLRDDGFDVAVFEKEAAIDGVWAPSRTYPGLRANNPRETYAFSDHPYDVTVDDFPRAEQIREYLASYVERFQLRAAIHLSTEVVSVSRAPSSESNHGGFDVVVRALVSSRNSLPSSKLTRDPTTPTMRTTPGDSDPPSSPRARSRGKNPLWQDTQS
ncbi:MAG: NAD(P)-binding protein [Candidatus Binatia bacterium]